MSRGLNSTLRSRFDDDSFYMATLLTMRRGGVLLRYTDHATDLLYENAKYTSSPFVLEIGSARESQELRVNDMVITLSGVDQSFISSFLNNSNFNADIVRIERGVFNPNSNVIEAAFIMFDGRIANYGISEDETSSEIAVTVASNWADFEKIINRKTNQNSQQRYFPDDMGFQYAAKVVKDLRWGRKA